ncbi:MAG: sigma-70 family RNA polymerase sigma factor [Candidatus Pacebacteria bacterium]|nr:sigma-70 family RNA polymerase sigma factor [Candidatus Paceibacterota bacterium]
MEERSDEKLIADYLRGDEGALEVLIKRYLKPIYSFSFRFVGNKQEAEDATQDVFVKVWRNLKKFDRKKSFKTWIFHIAKNTCIDCLKKKKAIPFSDFQTSTNRNTVVDSLVDSTSLPDELFKRIDVAQILKSAMEKLSPRYSMVLFLRHNDHFTFQEIAETMGEPLYTIKSRYRRALIQLRKMLLKQ